MYLFLRPRLKNTLEDYEAEREKEKDNKINTNFTIYITF